MHIRPITSADDAFASWYDVYRHGHAADYPHGPRFEKSELEVVHETHEYRDVKLWLAEEDQQALGAAVLHLPLRDNLSLGESEIWVRPEARRRGIGTALLEELETVAQQYGRTSLLSQIEGPASTSSTSGTRFAARHGFTHRITEIARVQRAPFHLARIAAAEEEARPRADGYEIVTWRGRTPDEYVREYARLEGRLSTDAPLGELDYEGEAWDEDRIRISERRHERMGRSYWTAVAVAPDGGLAGLTRISLQQHSDENGFQDSTLVDPPHRGHRLGLLLKAANLRAVLHDRPGIRAIWTWNAESNQHMISVNETLGYQVEGWGAGYQRKL
ncbi:GNAT family N-acetyltransferase [Actinobacteria bacterium YIM 96077]|uniref:GNAT family N-acetyltransferase n=1 Tax=Phytoactinopolyspora halophila TaxID=1981511 RepID=A0A329QLZ4_9ACTN|nr:GNAT family N-acetyltransferase [Phytoactinopolyspora halophila]AYY14701.1 GNAT family N-acetyltransferase [Actinobacteria bacterium YIM 96077]RAW11588.1 GNAT family N-acetyltransferase [Phytoactinopolyspora halophila]